MTDHLVAEYTQPATANQSRGLKQPIAARKANMLRHPVWFVESYLVLDILMLIGLEYATFNIKHMKMELVKVNFCNTLWSS